MTLLECKDMVLSKLKTLSVCKPNSAQTQWVVRCPYCGDSHDHTHGHFSILINRGTDDVMKYRCFKCNEAGLLTADNLEDLGLYLTEDERNAIRVCNRSSGKSSYNRNRPKNYKVPPVVISAAVEPKLQYLKQRIGVDFTPELITRCKIILSVVDFINMNHIPTKDLSYQLLQTLENYYVGFLSANNNKVTFRRINDNEKLLRYFKWTIDSFNTTPNNFYAPENIQVPLLYTDPIHIHIAEGTFDILSIMLNMEHDPSQMHLFYGSCGYNFDTIVKFLIYQGVNTDLTVELYSDADKSDYSNMKVLSSGRNEIWIDHAVIHRNRYPGEKDYGVPPERIIDGTRIIR